MAYAKDTDVPFERSISEIVGLLKRSGADQIAQVDQRDTFTIQFTLNDRMVRFRVGYMTIRYGREEADAAQTDIEDVIQEAAE